MAQRKLRQSAFIRGAQVFSHDLRMWSEAFKYCFWTYVVILIPFLIWWSLTKITSHEWHMAAAYLQSALWNGLKLNPNATIDLMLENGVMRTVTYAALQHFQPLQDVAISVMDRMLKGFYIGTYIGMVAGGFVAYLFANAGKTFNDEVHMRGAEMVPEKALRKLLRRDNIRQRKEELGRRYGGGLWYKHFLAPEMKGDPLVKYRPYEIAGIEFPYLKETTHLIISGAPGTGKTVAMRELVDQITERGDRAVVFDFTGSFIQNFYDPDTDIVLNPFDARTPAWNIFDECRHAEDFTAAAEAIIQDHSRSADTFWVDAAQTLFTSVLTQLRARRTTSNADIIKTIMHLSNKQLESYVKNTEANALVSADTAKMTGSIRAVLNTNLTALKHLKDDGPRFSLRDWIDAKDTEGLVFLSANATQIDSVRGLISLWMDIAIRSLLETERPRGRLTWFLFDEIAELHALNSLKRCAQVGRQYGGCLVLGLQVQSQLVEVYGHSAATTISGLMRNRLILSSTDTETSRWAADTIGYRVVKRFEEGTSYGANPIRDSVSLTPKEQQELLVIPDTVKNLKDLNGYLRFAGGFPVANVHMDYVEYQNIAPRFVPRPRNDDGNPLMPPGGQGPHGAQPSGTSDTTDDNAAVSASEGEGGPDPAARTDADDGKQQPASGPQVEAETLDNVHPIRRDEDILGGIRITEDGVVVDDGERGIERVEPTNRPLSTDRNTARRGPDFVTSTDRNTPHKDQDHAQSRQQHESSTASVNAAKEHRRREEAAIDQIAPKDLDSGTAGDADRDIDDD